MNETTPTHLLKRAGDTPAPQPVYRAPKKGRPKLNPHEKKNKRMTVLLTEKQQAIVDHAAQVIGFSSRSRMMEWLLIKFIEHVSALDREVRESFCKKRFDALAEEFQKNMGLLPPGGTVIRSALREMDAENIAQQVRAEYDEWSKRGDVMEELMALGTKRTLSEAQEVAEDDVPDVAPILEPIAAPMPGPTHAG